MSSLWAIIPIALLVACFDKKPTRNEVLGKTNAKVDIGDSIHDFGLIANDGADHTCEFFIRNIGTEKLVIHDIDAPCGCTKADYDHRPIAPGDSTKIVVIYNGKGKLPGYFNQTITVYSSAINGINHLCVKGEMLDKN